MRKILSLVLVAVLALGMGMVAFADTNPNGDSGFNYSKITSFASGSLGLVEGINDSNVITKNRTADMGTRYAMDEPKLTIDLWRGLFDGDLDDNYSYTEYYVPNLTKMTSGLSISFAGCTTIGDVLTALDTEITWYGNKGVAPADMPYKFLVDYFNARGNGATAIYNAFKNNGYVTTGSDRPLAFDDGTATGKYVTGGSVNGNDRLTSNEITKSKITMGTTVSGDSGLIRSLVLERSDGQIVLKLLKEFVSVVDKDIEVEIYLSFDGKRASDYSVTVYATLDNPILEVYANHDRVDIAKGYIARAQEFNTGIAVYTGNGVTVHTKMFKDKKYYCIAVRDADQADTRVFNEYRDVDNVITMKAVGLNNSDSYVTLSNDYSGYWVYDGNMNYLGRGDERLEYCAKYYLANKELDIAGDEEEEEEEEYEAPTSEAPAGNPGTGGSPAATNANLNPGTGR